MTMQPDRHSPDISPGGDIRPRRSGWRVLLRGLAVLMLVALGGFVWFLTLVRSDEQKPPRNADGIVVLTGGSSRVSDALELLSNGYGKRLLISGVHRANGVNDIVRSIPETQKLLTCCIDLDRSAVNTRSNATETRRWVSERGFKSLIVVTSNYHVPRARVELSHAMPDIDLIWYPVIGEKWRDEPWWSSGAALRLLLSEYVKYVVAEIRVRLEDRGLELIPDIEDQPTASEPAHRSATMSKN